MSFLIMRLPEALFPGVSILLIKQRFSESTTFYFQKHKHQHYSINIPFLARWGLWETKLVPLEVMWFIFSVTPHTGPIITTVQSEASKLIQKTAYSLSAQLYFQGSVCSKAGNANYTRTVLRKQCSLKYFYMWKPQFSAAIRKMFIITGLSKQVCNSFIVIRKHVAMKYQACNSLVLRNDHYI